ncbi:MAG: hypothetical protein K6L76_13550 [Agarilytica sp.]
MQIEVSGENSKFECIESTIRDLKSYCDDCDSKYSSKHFQAIFKDKRKNRKNSICCRLRYEGANGIFLGLDEENIYGEEVSGEIIVSMPITAPPSTEKVMVTITERLYNSITDRQELIIGMVIILAAVSVLVYAAKGFFNWQ